MASTYLITLSPEAIEASMTCHTKHMVSMVGQGEEGDQDLGPSIWVQAIYSFRASAGYYS